MADCITYNIYDVMGKPSIRPSTIHQGMVVVAILGYIDRAVSVMYMYDQVSDCTSVRAKIKKKRHLRIIAAATRML